MKEGKKSLEELKMEVTQTNSLEEYTKKLFLELAQVADYASLNDVERAAYDAKLKVARDNNSCLKFAHESGYKEGRDEERRQAKLQMVESARKMKIEGLSNTDIAKYTGITLDEVNLL